MAMKKAIDIKKEKKRKREEEEDVGRPNPMMLQRPRCYKNETDMQKEIAGAKNGIKTMAIDDGADEQEDN